MAKIGGMQMLNEKIKARICLLLYCIAVASFMNDAIPQALGLASLSLSRSADAVLTGFFLLLGFNGYRRILQDC